MQACETDPHFPLAGSPAENLLDPWLGPWMKGFPAHAGPLRRSQVGAQGWHVLAGDMPLPLAVVRQSALAHNLSWMQGFARSRGVGLAPHGKTTMSPQLFDAQLRAGAWGITVANAAQAQVAVAAGARRVLIANQVLTPPELSCLQHLLAAQPGLRLVFLLDSAAQLALIEATLPAIPFEVLLEIGLAGGRTGCRTHEEALALARLAHASPALRLVGVEGYEGLGATGEEEQDRPMAEGLMARIAAVARALDEEGLFDLGADEEVLVSAGGSGIFDLVTEGLRPALARPTQGLLRSGCYVTHDHGRYSRLVSVLNRRVGCDAATGLQAALEVWATVQSMPEPGLAFLTAGRRDVSYDIEMPIPVRVCARGERVPRPAPAGWRITGMNDQHAHLRLGADTAGLRVGDRVSLGISHPCTTFDKWRWMAIVDDDWRIVDALVTWF
ncbi:MAG: alanine racemase [Rubrivivax sp.]